MNLLSPASLLYILSAEIPDAIMPSLTLPCRILVALTQQATDCFSCDRGEPLLSLQSSASHPAHSWPRPF